MKKKEREIWNGQYDKEGKAIQPSEHNDTEDTNNIVVPAISIEEDLSDIDDDLDEIGEDTDELLRRMIKMFNKQDDNTSHTISTKRWVITLFLLDKVIMFILIIVAMKYGVGII